MLLFPFDSVGRGGGGGITENRGENEETGIWGKGLIFFFIIFGALQNIIIVNISLNKQCCYRLT